MSSYDGLSIADVGTRDVATRARPASPSSTGSRRVRSWTRGARVVGFALAFAAVVVGAALGGPMMLVSLAGIVAVVAGFTLSAVRWARADRAARR